MRGKVLGVDKQQNIATILGDDDQRYTFAPTDWKGGQTNPVAGMDVDFVVNNGKAQEVFPIKAAASFGEAEGGKSRATAAVLAILLGSLGVHKFYLGRTWPGIVMLLCTIPGAFLFLPFFVVCVIALIEFVIYLTKSDEQFHQDYVVNKKGWF